MLFVLSVSVVKLGRNLSTKPCNKDNMYVRWLLLSWHWSYHVFTFEYKFLQSLNQFIYVHCSSFTIIIIINEKINVAFTLKTARTRNTHKKTTSSVDKERNKRVSAISTSSVVTSTWPLTSFVFSFHSALPCCWSQLSMIDDDG